MLQVYKERFKLVDGVLFRLFRNIDYRKVNVKPGAEGYRRVKVDGRMHLVHRIVWCLYNDSDIPDGYVVDHKSNSEVKDDRPENLQAVPFRTNVQKDSTKNVYWNKQRGMWQVLLTHRCSDRINSTLHIGFYSSEVEAQAVLSVYLDLYGFGKPLHDDRYLSKLDWRKSVKASMIDYLQPR